MTKPTDYERAKIRLKAWKMLGGWGITTKDAEGKDIFTPWGLPERQRQAEQMAAWALAEPAVADGDAGEAS